MRHKKIFYLFFVAVSPVLLSWFFYYFHAYFHFKTENSGTLINPPLQMSEIFAKQLIPKKWQIILFVNDCDKALAMKKMLSLHQLRKALGEDSHRVVLLLWTTSACLIDSSYEFQRKALSAKQNHFLQYTFTVNKTMQNSIYLVDPLNNLFMFYSVADNEMHIFNDVKRVLSASQIG